ncbi:eRF1 domain 1-domain-containing protein [Aspergillus cavernicola]|uniref:Protein DOM34 homolog n=1 Tax=Aspergillus cavernicola TaxID=176166 RepID=A0ABR4HXI8_9EURO
MRLIKNRIGHDGSGSVTLIPDEPEDMWHAYNLIVPGDLLFATAVRRVTTTAATGSTSSSRIRLTLEIRVKTLDFDPQNSQLHVSGQIMNETPYTTIGQHHTLDLELNRQFTLEKKEGPDGEGSVWDSVAVEALKEAVDEGGNRKAEAIAVIMQEGLAHICFIGQFRTVLRQKVEMSVPKKRIGGDHDKIMAKFFKTTLDTLLRHMEFNTSATSMSNNDPVRPVLLASPGFVAAAFQKHIQTVAITTPALKRLLPSIIVVHSASGYTHSLTEVLQSQTVKTLLSNTKNARETKLMDDFHDQLRKETNKATYGPREVEYAVDQGAVGRGGGVLIISNELFRAQDVAERKRWVSLVDRVRDIEGGDVRVLSSEHESGKRLAGLGGIAALLTFPIDDDLESDNE